MKTKNESTKPKGNDLNPLITAGGLPIDKEVTLFELKADYLQPGDSCSESEINTLTIETKDAGAGVYYIIKTERFAFDNPNEIINLLNDFVRRFESNG